MKIRTAPASTGDVPSSFLRVRQMTSNDRSSYGETIPRACLANHRRSIAITVPVRCHHALMWQADAPRESAWRGGGGQETGPCGQFTSGVPTQMTRTSCQKGTQPSGRSFLCVQCVHPPPMWRDMTMKCARVCD